MNPRRTIPAVAALVALYLGYVWSERARPVHKTPPRAAHQDAASAALADWLKDDGSLRIVHFYASPGVLLQGDSASVCYAVRHARAVRLDPPVAAVRPAYNTCFVFEPQSTGTYKLTAEGDDCRTVSESLTITVEPAPPWFTMFSTSAKSIRRGEAFTMCYRTRYATRVRLEPSGMESRDPAADCLMTFPSASMGFTLTAYGARNMTDTRRASVVVR
jgi:hypothetical protein